MSPPFRFAPPVLRSGSLTRPRLVRALVGRWDRRVTIVVGGAGLGKTTLLAQAIAENHLAPRGTDVWLGAEPADADAEHLAADLLAALGGYGDRRPTAEVIADAVWQRSPSAVCLVIDDLHRVDPGSSGLDLVAALVEALPSNGHLLLSSRTVPPFALARLAALGEVLTLDEDDLRFNDDELAEFAARRGVDGDRVRSLGGWPALSELAASTAGPAAEDFVWEEVLRPLGDERRRVLGVLVDLGGGDDDLLSTALGAPVDLAGAVGDVPLVARDAEGWFQPHALWRSAAQSLRLPPEEAEGVLARTVGRLIERGRRDEAFDLLADAALWAFAPSLLRDACLGVARPAADRLRRWLARCPDVVRESAAGRLAAGVLAAMVDPSDADEPLTAAIAAFHDCGDVDGEMSAIAHLARVAWWRQDVGIIAALALRVGELAAAGHPAARALDGVGRALYADLAGDDAGILAALDDIDPASLDPSWEATVWWFRAAALPAVGNPASALGAVEAGLAAADPVMRFTLDYARQAIWWALGRVDDVAAGLLPASGAPGIVHNVVGATADQSRIASHLGDVETAKALLEKSRAALQPGQATPAVRVALAEASLAVAAGDEAAAGVSLAAAMATYPIETGTTRRAWRDGLALTYVLLPESRPAWDDARFRGHPLTAHRQLAAAVVAARAERPDVDVDIGPADLGLVRAALHHRFAAELAVHLHAGGRPEAAALLEALGAPGRSAVRYLAASGRRGGAPAQRAKALLASVPQLPPVPLSVAVLGPLQVRRGDDDVPDAELRRGRVRTLLAFLLTHRSTSRDEVTAALWPDLDEAAAANNLRVTMSYLLRALEPWRADRDPSYFVRTVGRRVDVLLTADTDAFDRHLRAAAGAEEAGTVSVALSHYLDAVDLYRGDLFADLADVEWLDLDREHYRSRFVATALRAAQLLLAADDAARAEELARRVLHLDPWSEDAYGVTVAAAVQRGDHEAARQLLERCFAALAELGVDPSEETRRLQRRVRSSVAAGGIEAQRGGSGST